MWQAIKTSWWPALCGLLALLCEGSSVAGLTPEEYRGAAQGVCMILVSLGLIGAKQANKTNAPEPTATAQKVPPKEGNGNGVKSIVILALSSALLTAGCATKYDDGVQSDFHTYQVGETCYTEGHGQMKFNAPTNLTGLVCHCDDLIPVKRKTVKAGQSPEVMSCPAPVALAKESKPMMPITVKAMADNYVPAIGQAASGLFIGGGIGAGIAMQEAARMTQSVGGGGFGPNYISTYNAGAGAIPGLPNGR